METKEFHEIMDKMSLDQIKDCLAYAGYLYRIKMTAEIDGGIKIKETLSQKVKCLTDNVEFDSIKAAVLYSKVPKTTFHRKLHNGELINGKKYELVH
jgi:hypothetical protein